MTKARDSGIAGLTGRETVRRRGAHLRAHQVLNELIPRTDSLGAESEETDRRMVETQRGFYYRFRNFEKQLKTVGNS